VDSGQSTGGLPGLRCVIAWSDRRNLCSTVGDALKELVGDSEIRRLGDEAFVVHTALSADTLRDLLRGKLSEYEGLLVIDFEVWSGYGKAVGATWLLRRGH
jgi:hypothetical protein